MRSIFRDHKGNKITNIVQYCKNFVNVNDGVKIHIGTDSQNSRQNSSYVTVIAFRFQNRGVHYIYHNRTIPKIRDIFTRLWKEVEFSVDLSNYLRENNIDVDKIELDFNKDKAAGSHMVLQSGTGYVIGMGYDVSVKPDELIAVKAADHLLRQ